MKSNPLPDVTIFIPTGNRAKSLEKVLVSLCKQTYKNFEVIVVDYKSNDKTRTLLSSFKKVLSLSVIEQTDRGLAKASNLALAEARGHIFIRTDDDIIASPNWIEEILKTFDSSKKIGGVTGPTVIPQSYKQNRDLFIFEKKMRDGSFLWKLLGKIYFGYFMENAPRRVAHWYRCGAFSLGSNFKEAINARAQNVSNLEPCNFAIRTSLARKVGGFDEMYEGVGEYYEADLAFKIQSLGYRLYYNPRVQVNHQPSREGFFNDRPDAASRMSNFMVFYLRHIKPNSVDKLVRFFSYLIFLNAYYWATAIRQKDIRQLGSVWGSIRGIMKHYQTKASFQSTMSNTLETIQPITDDRGRLVLFLQSDQMKGSREFGQLYFVTFEKKGVIRGNHYHKKCDEWFGIISGRVTVLLENVITHEKTTHILDANDALYVRLHIAPKMAHTIISLSQKAVLISYANRQWTPDDTYDYTIK